MSILQQLLPSCFTEEHATTWTPAVYDEFDTSAINEPGDAMEPEGGSSVAQTKTTNDPLNSAFAGCCLPYDNKTTVEQLAREKTRRGNCTAQAKSRALRLVSGDSWVGS
jgi:hypothetical protein